MPLAPDPTKTHETSEQTRARLLLSRRHREWSEHELRWRWMLDSLEGGDRYRNAVYGFDSLSMPVRNLIRHKREYPDPRELGSSSFAYPGVVTTGDSGGGPGQIGSDPASLATNDDYELRRARTPIPTFLAEAVDCHLGEVFSHKIGREGPDDLKLWWADVDGCGTPIDRWMEEAVAPLLMTLGQLDIAMDHPETPQGEAVDTKADQIRLGVDRCVAGYILPENMLWWSLDLSGRYEECLTIEYAETTNGPSLRYRHWTKAESVIYSDFELNKSGEIASGGEILRRIPNPFGRVPIVRVFDRRKPRCKNIGQSRYEGVAERQREYYNRDSELILSDTLQAHPLLQGPEDYVTADGSIPIGPQWLLPKKKNTQGGAATYEGFEVVDFPKDGAESIRSNKRDIRDDVDRETCQTKPAGVAGTDGKSTGQSGVSKRLDQKSGTKKLAKIASSIRRAEEQIAEYVLMVLRDAIPDAAVTDTIKIDYPRSFDLFSLVELSDAITALQAMIAGGGAAPDVEGDMIMAFVREVLPGRDDEAYEAYEEEIVAALDHAARMMGMKAEAAMVPPGDPAEETDLTAEGDPIEEAGDSPDENPLVQGVPLP